MDMKDKNRSLIKEYVVKWNLHDIKRVCQVNGFPAFLGIVMLFGLLSGGVSRADEEVFVNDFLTGLAVLLPIGLVWLSICLHPVKREKMYYLCPMDHDTRLRWMWQAYLCAGLIHLTVFLAGLIILAVLNGFEWRTFLLLFCNDLFFSFTVQADEKEDGFGYSLLFVFFVSVYLLTTDMCLPFVTGAEHSDTLLNLLLITAMAVELPLFWKILQMIRRKIQNAGMYEEAVVK